MCSITVAPKGLCVLDHLNHKTLFTLLALCLLTACGCRKQAPEHASSSTAHIIPSQLQEKVDSAMNGLDGAAVVMDVNTGRVLAMVNPKTAISQAFPVGSTLKPLTATASVEQGIADPDLALPCSGITSIHGHDYPCWLHGGHGKLNMVEALAQSCNIYFYTLGARFHGTELRDWARRFGFGSDTGIRNNDFKENAGQVPEILFPEKISRFATGDTPDFRATPLQMAVFTAAIANNGRRLTPRWQTDSTNKYLLSHPSKQFNGTVIRADKGLATARRGMALCVTSSLGTCHSLANMGFPAAGKTGTARHVTDLRTHAWFIGFTPVDEPEVAVVVFLQQGEGARDAAPVARRIMQAWHQCKKF